MTYKAIGFDYGGVLTGQPSSVLSDKIATVLGVSDDTYREVYYKYNRELNLGVITGKQLWISVLSELGKSDKFDDVMNILVSTKFGTPNALILKLVDDLRVRGFKTGLLSNNTVEAAEKMRSDGLEKHFDVLDISAETGFVKPEPKAFEHLSTQLHVKLNELIFVDDSEKSLSTAPEVGYTPVLYSNYANLVEQLTALGVLK